jgi:hypothetical protein
MLYLKGYKKRISANQVSEILFEYVTSPAPAGTVNGS